MRPSKRSNAQLRDIKITRNYTKHAEGSVLIEYGDTKVICNASVTPGVPRFLKGTNQGWVTSEYGMLPRSTHDRMQREATKVAPGGRTFEIQRLIARSLRTCLNLKLLGEYTIYIDCDVIQADGGTRTASITGGAVALYDAVQYMLAKKLLTKSPFLGLVASVSVGIYQQQAVLDLDYLEDSNAETDMNVVLSYEQKFIEVQGTAEKSAFTKAELDAMLDLAAQGGAQILQLQRSALAIT